MDEVDLVVAEPVEDAVHVCVGDAGDLVVGLRHGLEAWSRQGRDEVVDLQRAGADGGERDLHAQPPQLGDEGGHDRLDAAVADRVGPGATDLR